MKRINKQVRTIAALMVVIYAHEIYCDCDLKAQKGFQDKNLKYFQEFPGDSR